MEISDDAGRTAAVKQYFERGLVARGQRKSIREDVLAKRGVVTLKLTDQDEVTYASIGEPTETVRSTFLLCRSLVGVAHAHVFHV